jgi:hypothetical protein
MSNEFARFLRRALAWVAALGSVAVLAGGCVAAVEPGYDTYGYGYDSGPVYGSPVVVAPPPVVVGDGWHGRWHHHADGDWHWHAEHGDHHDGHRG